MTTFPMFAHRRGVPGKPEFHHIFPGRKQIELCGNYDIVEVMVRLAEDADGDTPYWGWLETGKDRPTMIYPSYFLLCVCFQAEAGMLERVERGFGKPVRLVVEARSESAQTLVG